METAPAGPMGSRAELWSESRRGIPAKSPRFWSASRSACTETEPERPPGDGGRELGPLHTRAKSRDHEIVRAQQEVSTGRPNTPPRSCSVVTGPQVYCEVVCGRALNQTLF